MPRSRLLLLDANIVIHLHEIGLWPRVVELCEIVLSETVIEEAHMVAREDGMGEAIDLSGAISDGDITVVSVDAGESAAFLSRFSGDYVDRMDPGELETLAYLDKDEGDMRVCSSDAIVFRTLSLLDRSERGISLEEVLESVSLGRRLRFQFTRRFQERERQRGFEDRIQGTGLA